MVKGKMKQADFFSNLSSQGNALLTQLTQNFAKPVRAKVLLVLNHVVAQEPEAQTRLRVYAGRKISLDTPTGDWMLSITPAGLFEEFAPQTLQDEAQEGVLPPAADLYLRIENKNPLNIMKFALKGQRPPVVIDGDADLASVFAWLVDNLRWDYAQDLPSIVGGSPTQLVQNQVNTAVGFIKNLFESFSKQKQDKK